MVSMSLLLLVIIPIISSSTSDPENKVLVLSSEDFDKALNTFSLLLVKFHAPWCGDCKTLVPEFQKAAQNVSSHSPPIHFAEVNVEENWELATKSKVSGIPTLKFFKRKERIDVPALHKSAELSEWAIENAHFVTRINSLEALQALEGSNKPSVVFFKPNSKQDVKILETLSTTIDSISFVVVDDLQILKAYGVSENSLWLFIKKEGKKAFSGKMELGEVTAFVNRHRFPSVVKLNEDVEKTIFEGRPGFFFFTEQVSMFLDTLKALEGESDELILTYANLKYELHSPLEERLGLNSTDQPIVMIVDTRNGVKKYLMEKIPTLDNLKAFINNWKQGKLPVFYKSEERPDYIEHGEIVRIIGKDFGLVVKNPMKNVLIYFADPDSVLCKGFEEEYKKVGSKLLDNFSFTIGRIDMKKNEVQGEDITEFPTLKLYQAGDKTPVKYLGEWDHEEVLKFLEPYTKVKITERTREGL